MLEQNQRSSQGSGQDRKSKLGREIQAEANSLYVQWVASSNEAVANSYQNGLKIGADQNVALILAMEEGNDAAFDFILSEIEDVNYRSGQFLREAIGFGNVHAVRQLVRRDDIKLKSALEFEGNHFLTMAAAKPEVLVLKSLYAALRGADVLKLPDIAYAADAAARSGNREAVEFLSGSFEALSSSLLEKVSTRDAEVSAVVESSIPALKS